MQLRFVVRMGEWQIRFPQAGSNTGWAEWETYDRQDALRRIEMGYSFEWVV